MMPDYLEQPIGCLITLTQLLGHKHETSLYSHNRRSITYSISVSLHLETKRVRAISGAHHRGFISGL
jgi:hypothetical protein